MQIVGQKVTNGIFSMILWLNIMTLPNKINKKEGNKSLTIGENRGSCKQAR